MSSEQGALPSSHCFALLVSGLASCTGSFLLTDAALGYGTFLTGIAREKSAFLLFCFMIGLGGFL